MESVYDTYVIRWSETVSYRREEETGVLRQFVEWLCWGWSGGGGGGGWGGGGVWEKDP